jgi:GH35 family endo-1,4-beta-xylanase
MRHYSSSDPRYLHGRSPGIIPFYSWDVLNEEIHESRHAALIPQRPNEWKTGLRQTSWLRAMTGDDFSDLRQHYVYLLFKYAHIAVPNATMAAKYQANYASLPAYMKLDGHDDGTGNIDAFVVGRPPVLYYNDYNLNSPTKSKVMYNMVKELNTLWLSDPLYDGRPLIEGLGMQAHYYLKYNLEGQVRDTLALFSSLIDEGLVKTIGISECDLLTMEDSAPGGAHSGTAIPSQMQADALGYQFALLYKLYTEYHRYIERVTSWGIREPGYSNRFIFFRNVSSTLYATPGYYGAYDPDRYIAGHSYLDYYFKR